MSTLVGDEIQRRENKVRRGEAKMEKLCWRPA